MEMMIQLVLNGPFKKTTGAMPENLPIIKLSPNEKESIFFSENSISVMENGQKITLPLKGSEQPFLVFARYKESLSKGKPDAYANNVKSELVTPLMLSKIKSGEIDADVLVEPGYEQELFPKLTAKKKASHVVHLFNEARVRHPKDIEIANRSNYPIFVAAYNCLLDAGDIIQNKRCTKAGGSIEIGANAKGLMKDIHYDVRARDYSGMPGNEHFAYLIMSRMEDDLTPTRDLRESAMRHVVQSTRRAYNALYDLVKKLIG